MQLPCRRQGRSAIRPSDARASRVSPASGAPAVGKTDKAAGEALKGTFKAGEEKEVAVPAGKYADVVTSGGDDLDGNGQKVGFTYYFAKDVGMVKQVIDRGGQKVTIEPEKFEPAAKK